MFPLVCSAILLGIFAFFAPYYVRKQKEQLEGFKRFIFRKEDVEILQSNFTIFGFPLGYYLRLKREELSLEIHFTESQRRHPAYAIYYIPLKHNHKLSLSREEIVNTIGKTVGIIKDIEIGQPEIDKAFIIRASEENSLALNLLRSGDNLQALTQFSHDVKLTDIMINPSSDLADDTPIKSKSNILFHTWPGIVLLRTGGRRTFEKERKEALQVCDFLFQLAKTLT